MKILLTGKNGQVGYELVRGLQALAEVVATDRHSFDLASTVEIEQKIKTLNPDLIINAAAYTAVDKAEQDYQQAHLINSVAPSQIAQTCRELGIPIIHFSTDYVFDGSKGSPWKETDTPSPINAYGETKLGGELAIQASGAAYMIFRTSWVYGARGHNFYRTMCRLAEEKTSLNIVDDQMGAPTWSRHIADVVCQIITMAKSGEQDFWQENSGLYHLTASGQTSWYGFANAIFEELSQKQFITPSVTAITSKDYPLPAKRPVYSCLDNSLLKKRFSVCLPDWRASLALVMQD